MPRNFKKFDTERELFESEARPHLDVLYSIATPADPLTGRRRGPGARHPGSRLPILRRFEAGTNFKAWLLRIQMNTFVNRYRRATRERQVFEGPMAMPVGEGVMGRATMRGLTDPVGDAQRRLIGREIQRAFDELSEDARAMVLLADVEELSYKEISEIVGCPIGTVMSRLHRARKQLQGSLQSHAVQLGIIEDDEKVDDPIPLEAFRARKLVKS